MPTWNARSPMVMAKKAMALNLTISLMSPIMTGQRRMLREFRRPANANQPPIGVQRIFYGCGKSTQKRRYCEIFLWEGTQLDRKRRF